MERPTPERGLNSGLIPNNVSKVKIKGKMIPEKIKKKAKYKILPVEVKP
jgi:hypothetical protein